MINEHPKPGARVFIANMGYHSYDGLKKWGKIQPITTGSVYLGRAARVEGNVYAVLGDFNENDYLYVSGHSLISVLAAGYIFRKLGYVDLLIWLGSTREVTHRRTYFNPEKIQKEKDKEYGQREWDSGDETGTDNI